MGSMTVEEVSYVAGPYLTLYPALLLLYGGRLASVAAKNHRLMLGLHSEATIWALSSSSEGEQKAGIILSSLSDWKQLFQTLPDFSQSPTPVSDYLHRRLREPFRQIEPDNRRYDKLFDRFEYLAAIEHGHVFGSEYMPIGRFGRLRRYPEYEPIMREIEAERNKAGRSWAPIKAGMCGQSTERFLELKQRLDEQAKRFGWT